MKVFGNEVIRRRDRSNGRLTTYLISTVDSRGKISEPHAAGTSKLDWRSLESMQIDRNKVQIRTKAQNQKSMKI